MNPLEKLNALKQEELQNIKGGSIPPNGPSLNGPILYGTDRNEKRLCRCTGTGANENLAARCSCSDERCNAEPVPIIGIK